MIASQRRSHRAVGTSLEPLSAAHQRSSAAAPKKFRVMKGLFGGRTRTRTLDPLIKSQLSYAAARNGVKLQGVHGRREPRR
jgi:hypothetical protein